MCFNPQNSSRRSGFALVLALVVMTLVFAAASGLYLTRQMWAFNSAKQLDAAMMRAVTRADSQRWVLEFRDYFQPLGLDLEDTQPTLSSPATVSYDGKVFTPTAPYPEYPGTLGNLPLLLKLPDTGSFAPDSLGSGDLFFGTPSFVGRVGVLFRQEIAPADYAIRVGRLNASDPTLRAWYTIDGALPTSAVVRAIPVSAFTYFVGRREDDSVASGATLGSWLSGSGAYSTGNYVVGDVGAGRIYVEGVATVTAPFASGFPVVATDGFVLSGGNIVLNFPSFLGGGATTASWGGPTDFYEKRVSDFRGMLATSGDSAVRVLRPNSSVVNNRHRATSVTALATALSAYAAVTVTANVDTSTFSPPVYDAAQFSGSPADIAALTNSDSWTFDAGASELIFHPPAGFLSRLSVVPTSLVVNFTGAGAGAYKLRVRIPSVGALSGGPTRFSLVVPSNPVILEGGFNGGSPAVAAMVVAPTLAVDHPSVPASPYAMAGVFVTEAYDNLGAIRYFGAGGVPAAAINGSFVIWRLTAASPGGVAASYTLTSNLNYLSGSLVPSLVPAVTDLRAVSEGFRLYRIFAGEEEEIEDPDAAPTPSPSPES